MKAGPILFVVITGFFSALFIFLILVYQPFSQTIPKQSQFPPVAASVSKDSVDQLKSKSVWLEDQVATLSEQQKQQQHAIEDIKTSIGSTSAATTQTSGKSILAVANTKGTSFTTTSAVYSPMGMYVNVTCPVRCYLWINFYSSSKNLGTPSTTQGFINTYDVFLNNSDQSIFAQASYPAAGSAIPISINVTIPVEAGTHTIDIRAKTSGGTLQSDSSALQVMAIER